MTWYKVDDQFWSHPKVMRLSDAAVALWVKAGSYSCCHLTDGFIEISFMRLLGTLEAAQELVEAGLWMEVEGGFMFHDWEEYQETSTAVKQRREQAKERMRKVRSQNVRANKKRTAGATNSERSREQNENVRENNSGTFAGSSQEVRSTPIPIHRSPNGDQKKSKEKSQQFAEFWAVVPRKTGKKAAQAAFDKAVSSGVDPNRLVAAMAAYRDDPNREDRYTKHPATWLNQGCWEDEPLPARGGSPGAAGRRTDLDEFLEQSLAHTNSQKFGPLAAEQSPIGARVPERELDAANGPETDVVDAEFWTTLEPPPLDPPPFDEQEPF